MIITEGDIKKMVKAVLLEYDMAFNIKGVYHVSSEEFEEFKEKNFPYFFFSSRPIQLGKSKNTYVCDLSMHKPFVFEYGESWGYPLWLYLTDKSGNLIPEEEFTQEKFDGYLGCPFEFWKMVYYDEDEWETDQIPDLVKRLDLGYDGVIIKNVYEGDNQDMVDDYIVFKPEQIRIVEQK